jgi:hypothetical protein
LQGGSEGWLELGKEMVEACQTSDCKHIEDDDELDGEDQDLTEKYQMLKMICEFDEILTFKNSASQHGQVSRLKCLFLSFFS